MVAVERLAAHVTDLVIAVSEDERRAFLAQKAVPAERVEVIYNGVDVTPFREAERRRKPLRAAMGFDDDICVISTICRLHKPRDFGTLLEAFAALVKTTSRVHLLIIGDGPEQSEVIAKRDDLGLTAWVTLTGGRGDIPDLLAASDIFTLTTWGWEGMPFTILEAMAASRPVVATCAGGISEVVSEGVTGLMVPRRDVNGLADAFSRLVHSPELCARMGAAGRERVEGAFSRERMIQLTASAYMKLLSDSSRGDAGSV
jgi:glycosyltransferase involved in cell wall biosynthesis